MRQVPSDKYNVAWFKLAECVARGEKERALCVYRLLSYSIDDPALACQLKGDILWAFDDEDAINTYREAALLYTKHSRLLQAAAVYEHVRTLVPDDYTFIEDLIDIYAALNVSTKVIEYSRQLFLLLLEKGELSQAHQVLKQVDHLDVSDRLTKEHQRMVFALLDTNNMPTEQVIHSIKKAIDGLVQQEDTKELGQFLAKLEAVSNDCYMQACAYIEEDSFTQ